MREGEAINIRPFIFFFNEKHEFGFFQSYVRLSILYSKKIHWNYKKTITDIQIISNTNLPLFRLSPLVTIFKNQCLNFALWSILYLVFAVVIDIVSSICGFHLVFCSANSSSQKYQVWVTTRVTCIAGLPGRKN